MGIPDNIFVFTLGWLFGILFIYLCAKHYFKKHEPKYKYHYDVKTYFGLYIHGDSNDEYNSNGDINLWLTNNCKIKIPRAAISYIAIRELKP